MKILTLFSKRAFTLACCLILAVTAALFAAGCTKEEPEQPKPVTYPQYLQEIKSTDDFTETAVYIKNTETDRKVYCYEIVPKNIGDKKVPLIIYVHGGSGDVTSVIAVPEGIAKNGIAGITFECCGANRVKPMSDGKELYNSHYTSRMSDLESVIAHAKTLDYVDTSRIYICGQSMGGLVCMLDAPRHNDDIKGMLLISTGLTEDGSMVTREGNGLIEKYLPPEGTEAVENYINTFTKDILIFCSQGDSTGAHDNGKYTSTIYQKRTEGKVKFFSFENGEHAFNTFTQEAKQTVFAEMAALVKNNGVIADTDADAE